MSKSGGCVGALRDVDCVADANPSPNHSPRGEGFMIRKCNPASWGVPATIRQGERIRALLRTFGSSRCRGRPCLPNTRGTGTRSRECLLRRMRARAAGLPALADDRARGRALGGRPGSTLRTGPSADVRGRPAATGLGWQVEACSPADGCRPQRCFVCLSRSHGQMPAEVFEDGPGGRHAAPGARSVMIRVVRLVNAT